jgi:hypothetical protein
MKELSAILKEKYGNSATAKRAQLRNEIVVRGDEILAELANGWSLRAIWTALSERKELTCGYKTFIAHVRRLQQAATTETKAITPEKRKGFTWDPTPNREELIGT